MANILLLYGPRSDGVALSGGAWTAGLPLSNLANERLSAVARSVDTQLANTWFKVALPEASAFKALVLGPMNVTSAYKYRIRTYTSAAFNTVAEDTGWVSPTIGSSGGWLAPESDWLDPDWWLGVEPFDDAERGVYLIHVFDTEAVGRWWSFEIDDQFNPAGYIEIGRLFMPDTFSPGVNYPYDDNGLGFVDNSLSAKTLGGQTDYWHRVNPRTFRFGLQYLSEHEGFSAAYRFMRVAGFSREVFVIPDPDDVGHIQQRSFLGTIRKMDALKQHAFAVVGTGYEIEERI